MFLCDFLNQRFLDCILESVHPVPVFTLEVLTKFSRCRLRSSDALTSPGRSVSTPYRTCMLSTVHSPSLNTSPRREYKNSTILRLPHTVITSFIFVSLQYLPSGGPRGGPFGVSHIIRLRCGGRVGPDWLLNWYDSRKNGV
jgi:hypothetical protein